MVQREQRKSTGLHGSYCPKGWNPSENSSNITSLPKEAQTTAQQDSRTASTPKTNLEAGNTLEKYLKQTHLMKKDEITAINVKVRKIWSLKSCYIPERGEPVGLKTTVPQGYQKKSVESQCSHGLKGGDPLRKNSNITALPEEVQITAHQGRGGIVGSQGSYGRLAPPQRAD